MGTGHGAMMALLPRSPRAVLTGAGSGFGRALALELARRGGRLLLSDRDLASCEETAELARGAGATSARALRCDVTKIEEVAALAAASQEGADPGVDLVVNNAGVSSGGAVGELPLDDWRWTIDVNLFGVIHGCHVFTPILRRQGHGHLLNMASAAGLIATPRAAAYNVSKAGVVALSETLAVELDGTGVGVTVLCPTFFRTNIVANGRFRDPKIGRLAQQLLDRGPDADVVARAALDAVARGRLYCVPMADGRWAWRAKRLLPERFAGLVARVARRMAGQG